MSVCFIVVVSIFSIDILTLSPSVLCKCVVYLPAESQTSGGAMQKRESKPQPGHPKDALVPEKGKGHQVWVVEHPLII